MGNGGVSTYIVECWPGRTVEVEAMNEEDAFVKAVLEHGWIGGSESTGNGIRFMAWVKEKE
jgi:hypothetical protein